MPGEGHQWEWPEFHGELEPEARGRWDGGTECRVSRESGSLIVRGLGFLSGGGPGPGSCGLVPDPDPRQAEQWHGRGPEGADGAHPLDASLRQRERPALRQLHVPRSQPAGNI